MRSVVITGLGICCALGNDPQTVVQRLAQGHSGLTQPTDERAALAIAGLGLASVDVRPLLKRRKDRKLLPRAAELGIWAAIQAMGPDRPVNTGVFLGVGREPPDNGETEHALLTSMVDGQLNPERLLGPGRAAYPPLASLRTLPNLVLAHIAIQLNLMGPCGTRAGADAAGIAAISEGYYAVKEGRAHTVLVGAADSVVSSGLARDLVRLGQLNPQRGAGEGAAMLRLESADHAAQRGATVLGQITSVGAAFGSTSSQPPHDPFLGYCGAANAAIALVLAIAAQRPGTLHGQDPSGAHSWIQWERQ